MKKIKKKKKPSCKDCDSKKGLKKVRYISADKIVLLCKPCMMERLKKLVRKGA